MRSWILVFFGVLWVGLPCSGFAQTYTCEILLSQPRHVRGGLFHMRKLFENRTFVLNALNRQVKGQTLERLGWGGLGVEELAKLSFHIPPLSDTALTMSIQVQTSSKRPQSVDLAPLVVQYPPIYVWLMLDDGIESFERHMSENLQGAALLIDDLPASTPFGFFFEHHRDVRTYLSVRNLRGGHSMAVIGVDVPCETLTDWVERGEHTASPVFVQTPDGVLCRLPVAYFFSSPKSQPTADGTTTTSTTPSHPPAIPSSF